MSNRALNPSLPKRIARRLELIHIAFGRDVKLLRVSNASAREVGGSMDHSPLGMQAGFAHFEGCAAAR